MIRRRIIIAGLACTVGSAAFAGPLNKAWVARDAQWVAHVDIEAGLASTLGRYVVAHRDELDLKGLDQVKAETGIDPLADIKSVTIYGGANDGSDGIAVIHTTAAVEDLIKRLQAKEKSLVTVTVNGMTVYSWNDDGVTRFAQIRAGPKEAERIVIVGAEKDRLLSGIAVLEGGAPALSGQRDGVVAASPKGGSFLFAALNKLPQPEATPFKKAESVVLDIGEADSQIYGDLLVNATTSQDASNMMQVMQGGLALLRMAASADPEHPEFLELAALADGITFGADESRITARFRYSAEKLGACLNGLASLRKSIDERKSGTRTTKPRKDNAGSKD